MSKHADGTCFLPQSAMTFTSMSAAWAVAAAFFQYVELDMILPWTIKSEVIWVVILWRMERESGVHT